MQTNTWALSESHKVRPHDLGDCLHSSSSVDRKGVAHADGAKTHDKLNTPANREQVENTRSRVSGTLPVASSLPRPDPQLSRMRVRSTSSTILVFGRIVASGSRVLLLVTGLMGCLTRGSGRPRTLLHFYTTC